METGGIEKAESVRIDQVRTEQRRADAARSEEQKKVDQNNREVSESPKVAEGGRGENVDLTV